MKPKSFTILAIVTLILFLGFISYLKRSKDTNIANNINSNSTQNSINGTSFNKTGRLLKNNPGFKENVWYLHFEEPGFSAINIELQFDNKSSCITKNKRIKCDPDKFENGNKAIINGIKTNSHIVIETLEFIE